MKKTMEEDTFYTGANVKCRSSSTAMKQNRTTGCNEDWKLGVKCDQEMYVTQTSAEISVWVLDFS